MLALTVFETILRAMTVNSRHPLPAPDFSTDNISLFLDFDGTLVDIAAKPDAVIITDQLRELLARLYVRLNGRLAIVSGRDVNALRREYGLVQPIIAGSHGLEISMQNGHIAAPARHPQLDDALQQIHNFARNKQGLVVEEKALSIGLHYRGAPHLAEACIAFTNQLALRYALLVQQGKMVAELRLANANKGTAIKSLMQADPFKGHKPVFLGDDVTDEDGFQVVAELGGYGILVGDDRSTAAQFRLPDVFAVQHWLERI